MLTQFGVLGFPAAMALLALIRVRHDGPSCNCGKCVSHREAQR